MATDTVKPNPALLVTGNVYFEGELHPHGRAYGRALDLFAQAEGFHSFAEFAAERFAKGLFIRFEVEKITVFMDPNEGWMYRTARDCIKDIGRRPRRFEGYRISFEEKSRPEL